MSDKTPIPITKDPKSYFMPKEENHDTPVSFRIAARVHRQIEITLQDVKGLLPWKTVTDFYRWAVENSLRQLAHDFKDKKFSVSWAEYEAALELLREQGIRRLMMELVEQTRKEVHQMENLGAFDEVPRFLRNMSKRIDGMAGMNYWSRKLRKEFDREFGSRIKQGRISVRPEDAEKDKD